MRKYWIAITLLTVTLLATPVIAAPAAQVSIPALVTEILNRLKQIETQQDHIEELLVAQIERRFVLDKLNCEYAEARNPEPKKYLDGMRVYDNYETALACLYYRNPPGHIYRTPRGHVNPPGHEFYTNIEVHSHDHLGPHSHDDKEEVPPAE